MFDDWYWSCPLLVYYFGWVLSITCPLFGWILFICLLFQWFSSIICLWFWCILSIICLSFGWVPSIICLLFGWVLSIIGSLFEWALSIIYLLFDINCISLFFSKVITCYLPVYHFIVLLVIKKSACDYQHLISIDLQSVVDNPLKYTDSQFLEWNKFCSRRDG